MEDLKQKLVWILVGGASLFLVSMPFYRRLETNDRRSEAKITLGFIQTLQKAHWMDQGRYVAMTENYGAALEGVENCTRPQGAVELGLILRSCGKSIEDGGLRYAYSIELTPDGEDFVARAVSGSELSGKSFICREGQEELTISKSGEAQITKHCL